MIDNKKRTVEKKLRMIEIQLGSVSGIKKRHALLKKQECIEKGIESPK